MADMDRLAIVGEDELSQSSDMRVMEMMMSMLMTAGCRGPARSLGICLGGRGHPGWLVGCVRSCGRCQILGSFLRRRYLDLRMFQISRVPGTDQRLAKVTRRHREKKTTKTPDKSDPGGC